MALVHSATWGIDQESMDGNEEKGMLGFFRFLFGVVVGMVAGFLVAVGAMNYHFLRTENSLAIVPKAHAKLANTYVDIRAWTVSDWTAHPDMVLTLIQNDRADLLPGGQLASWKKLIEH